jgi:cytochrome b6-f complex iron-sulfur subunit
MVDKSKMTVADILAAARKADSQGADPAGEETSADEAPAAPASEAKVAEQAASESKPKPAAAAKKIPATGAGRPSVAEMMAMARGDKSGAAASAPEAKEKPSPPPAAKPAAAKAAPKKESPVAKAEPLDTQSILAAARKSTKPGPMTKAEAAAKPAPAAPDAKKAKAKEAIVVPPMPVKPDYAKKPAAGRSKDEVAERRAFLFGMSALAVGFTALSATMGLWTAGTIRFMFPNILREPPSRFKVGSPDQFAPGQVETKYKAQFGVWIVNTEFQGEQEIVALRSVCTHLGCTPNWLEAEQKFKCPCHGSGFYKDGVNFEGPAPRPLERFAISIANDGQIEVDKSRTFHEEMGQWADPACYIPA